MKLRADLHIHSEYSFDSKSELNGIIRVAKKRGLDIIAITDHEEFLGADKLSKISNSPIVIKGEEIDTEYGDIIGLFLKKKIKTKKFSEVVSEIKKQRGLIVLPHPAMNHILIDEVLKNVDLVEVFNSRIGNSNNSMAKLLSEKIKKPGIAGSDAHFFFEIGNGITIIDTKSTRLEDIKKALIEGRFKLECKRSGKFKRYWAKIVKIWRRRK
jgi:predicted metal-dependent phosphoesterase TrpH